MKKVILIIALLATAALAQSAKMLEVISENILKVEQNGEVKKIHLAGIELFAKANKATRKVGFDTKESLKQEALTHIKKMLPPGSQIKYGVIGVDAFGVEKVWIQTEELNYNLVRNGYAVVDVNDPYLPDGFEMRMTVAMKYAKDKQFGLWGAQPIAMAALIDLDCHMCGWKNSKKHQGLTRMDVVRELQARLPKQSKFEKIAYNNINHLRKKGI